MKKIILVIFGSLTSALYSQVGINTATPESTFDIRGKNHLGPVTSKDGILIPRVTDLVNNGTVESQLVYLANNSGIYVKGFYYWNGNKWIVLSSDGDAWGVTGEDQSSDISRTGSVGIGSVSVSNYAKLEISSSNQGILIPKINLTSNTLDLNADGNNSIADQPKGLMVFNSGNILPVGFYYWNGSEWRSIDNSSAVAPEITSLNCLNAVLSPSSYTAGIYYSGTLTVPYVGGNEGKYQSGSTVVINGLSFILRTDKLKYGPGELVFSVNGTPTVSSPNTTTIPMQGTSGNNLIPFLKSTQSCNVEVGGQQEAEIKTKAITGPLTLNTEGGYTNYQLASTTPDGKFSIRIRVPQGASMGEADIEIRSNDGPKTLMWNYHTEYQGGEYNGASNAFLLPNSGIWYGNGGSGILDTATTGSTSAWGDPDVYYIAPEHRRYTWYTTTNSEKVVYDVLLMMGAPNSSLIANATNCPGGSCNTTKAYIKIEQVKAQ